MPYVECPHCRQRVYTGAGWSFRRACPSCGGHLDGGEVDSPPAGPAPPRRAYEQPTSRRVHLLDLSRAPAVAAGGPAAGSGRPRPLRREGLPRRMALFALAAVGSFLGLAITAERMDPELVLVASVLTLLILASPFVVPFHRLPRWTEAVPPLSYFVVVALLHTAPEEGVSGLEPLVLLPVVWLALYGTRAELVLSLVGAAASLAVPAVLVGAGEVAWREIVVWLFVAPTVGFAIQELVRMVERRAREALEHAHALAEGEEAVERILGAVGQGVVGIDRECQVRFVNPAAETLLAASSSDAVGRRSSDLLRLVRDDGAPFPRGESPLDRAFAGEVVHRSGDTCVRFDATAFAAEYVAVPIVREGAVDGVVLTIQDISRRLAAERELRTHAESLERVSRVAREISTGGDARPRICDAARELGDAAMAFLLEPDGNGNLASTAASGEDLPAISIRVGEEASGAALAFTEREALFVARARGDRRVSQRLVETLRAASVLYQPVLRGTEATGVLVVAWRHHLEELPQQTRAAVALLATEAGVAFERSDLVARAEELARTDSLTGLPNRRAIEDELPRELARARREGESIYLAVLDLDGFKGYNDAHGHAAGDELLARVAGAWRTELRPFDLLARYGGDEFALMIGVDGEEAAVEVLERLRRATPGEVTCSAGLVRWDGEPAPALLARADGALYAAKRGGRDRAVLEDGARPAAPNADSADGAAGDGAAEPTPVPADGS